MDEEELKAKADAEAAEKAKLEAENANKPKVDDKPVVEDKDKNKPSDAEAKLIKEIMKLKEKAKAEENRAKELEGRLSGIDLEAAKEALKKLEEQENNELERKGEYQRLLEKQKEAADNDRKALEEKLENERKERESLARAVDELTLGNAFANSRYIQDKLALTPSKTRALYASHFEIKDGQLVAYDKPKDVPNRTAIVDASGDHVNFDAAIEAIINSDPDKDYLIKSDQKAGAGSKGTSIDPSLAGKKEIKSPLEKIAEGLSNKKNFGPSNLA
jgi:predicted RNase H-like nuclease (RuvC/YqgF family)